MDKGHILNTLRYEKVTCRFFGEGEIHIYIYNYLVLCHTYTEEDRFPQATSPRAF